MKSLSVTIQMEATEQYSPVVLFIMLYKVVLTILYVNEILWCDHSNESYWAVLSCGTVYYAVQGGSNFWNENQMKATEQYFLLVLVIMLWSVSNMTSYWVTISSCGFQKNWGYCQRIMLIVVVFVPEKGKLFGMGDNTENQLGINQRGRTEEPILKVSVPSRIHLSTHSRASKPIQVSCGAFHTAVVTG